MQPFSQRTEIFLLAVAMLLYLSWVGLFLFRIDPWLRRKLEKLFAVRIRMSWTTVLWNFSGVRFFSRKGLALHFLWLLCFGSAALGPLVLLLGAYQALVHLTR